MDTRNTAQRRLSPRARTGLDGARALAAIYVVLHHFVGSRWHFAGAFEIFRFGQEAVIVFFLLSGFVIYYNEWYRLDHVSAYYMRRVRRIYPPLLLALVVSTVVFALNGDLDRAFNWRALLGTLGGLQDIAFLKPGVIVKPYLDNAPLWSLSYELFFYLVFPLVMVVASAFTRKADHIIGGVCVAAYVLYVVHPNHWSLVISYFEIWWVGAMAAKAYLAGGSDFRAIGHSLSWLGALSLAAGLACFYVGYHGLGYYPFLLFRHFAVALLLCVVSFSAVGRRLSAVSFGWAPQLAWLASISYGIYVLHYPLLVQWNFAKTPAGLVVAIALLVTLAFLVDRKLNRMLAAPKRTLETTLAATQEGE